MHNTTSNAAALPQLGYRGYYMPGQADRGVVALYKWLSLYSNVIDKDTVPLPRSVLFDHFAQHTSHCLICQKALKRLKKMKRLAQYAFVLSFLLSKRLGTLLSLVLSLASLGVWNLVQETIEPSFHHGDFKHYENN